MIYTLGIDPGRTCGIGLVATPPRGRQTLLGAWCIRAGGGQAGWSNWIDRLSDVIDRVETICQDLDTPLHYIWMEEPPPVSRRGALAGDKRGQRTWMGIGQRMGAVRAVVHLSNDTIHEAKFDTTQAGEWCRIVRVYLRKRGQGEHRVAEAKLYLEDALTHLEPLPEWGRIDAAEAALIAAAAGIHHRHASPA